MFETFWPKFVKKPIFGSGKFILIRIRNTDEGDCLAMAMVLPGSKAGRQHAHASQHGSSHAHWPARLFGSNKASQQFLPSH